MTPDSAVAYIPPARIVYGTDFSEASARVLPRVLELAESCRADVELVHVLTESRTGPGTVEIKEGHARSRLEHLRMAYAYGFAGRGQVRLSRAVVVSSDPAKGMLEAVRNRPSTLLALGSHGASGVAQHPLGSVTKQLLLQPVGPALVVPSTGSMAERIQTIVAVQTAPAMVHPSPVLRMSRVLAGNLEAALQSVVLGPPQARTASADAHEEGVAVKEAVSLDPSARATWVEAVLRAASGLGADLVVVPRRLVLAPEVSHDRFAVALASTASFSLLVI